MTDPRLDKWTKWIDDRIKSELWMMYLQREVLRTVSEIAQRSQQPPSYFWQFLRDTYATTQALAIRRQADSDPRVISLGRLLVELNEDPSTITREWHLTLWPDDDLVYAREKFESDFGGAVGEHLDPAMVETDLASLRNAAASVKRYVDQHLAHSDAARPPASLRFDDIDSALDRLGELFQKYADLLTATDVMLVPVIQHDWQAIFRQPWISPGGE